MQREGCGEYKDDIMDCYCHGTCAIEKVEKAEVHACHTARGVTMSLALSVSIQPHRQVVVSLQTAL